MAGWNANTLVSSSGDGSVTILEGSSFCVSGIDGDIVPHLPQGLFVRDTRILSRWTTRIDGRPIEALSVETAQPHRTTLLGRARTAADQRTEGSLMVERRRTVGIGLGEILTLRNFSSRDASAEIEMRFGADFADLFDVKASRRRRRRAVRSHVADGVLILQSRAATDRPGVAIRADGARIRGSRLIVKAHIPARGSWTMSLRIAPSLGGQTLLMPAAEHEEHDRRQEQQYVEWHSGVSRTFIEDDDISATVHQGQVDIGALRIVDPEHPDRTVVAAGAPWFMALFGRDSILSSIMTLPVDPSIALGTFASLGDRQGTTVDDRTEEQPGKILHEVRMGAAVADALGGRDTYFGSVDATPLFVVGVGELIRWGVPSADAPDLLTHVDRCLEWIDTYGDRDGDGFTEYAPSSDHSLVNQGWKDSWDAICFADGTIAAPPIALCEVQGYVYAAFRTRARLARDSGADALAHRWEQKAETLKEEFNRRFWLPDRGFYALALDKRKRPVDALASNMGHCLWSGIVDDDKAAAVAERLMSPEMFTGWGVRTLSSDMARYNPVSYHNGSVWPHDNALIAAGLMRYGFVEEAQRVAQGLFDAADHFGNRLPELFCGFSRDDQPRPVSYPNACSPQAWAAATPISLVRTLLRLDVDAAHKTVRINPALPSSLRHVRIENMLIAGARVDIAVEDGRTEVRGLPTGYSLDSGTEPARRAR